jgi:hypothetical protein
MAHAKELTAISLKNIPPESDLKYTIIEKDVGLDTAFVRVKVTRKVQSEEELI